MVLAPVFKLLEASFELLVPLLIAGMVDQMIPKKDQSGLVLLVFYLSGLALLGVIVALIAQYVAARAAIAYTRNLSNALFEKTLSLAEEERQQLGESSVMTRLWADTYQVQTGINLFLRLFLRAPIIVIGAIVMAFHISPSLTGIFLVMTALLLILVYGLNRFILPLYRSARQGLEELTRVTREQLAGMRTIRAFSQEREEQVYFNQVNQSYEDLQVRLGQWTSALTPLTFLLVNISLLVLLSKGSLLVSQGQLSQGMLVALVNYLLQILAELLKAVTLASNLNQAYASAKRIEAVFQLPSEDLKNSLGKEESPSDAIFFAQNLGLTYVGGREAALADVTFSLPKGQFLGIIGGTGAGKTSLIRLLAGQRQPTQGQLFLTHEGQSANCLEVWRNLVSLVPQKAQLFQGTIRENLLLGWSTQRPDDQALWEALEDAQAADFVREKEGGLDALVQAFGRNFSGGQRQRLTIARALLRNRPILILDDATSALDYVTESRLLKVIHEKYADLSLIMVSQRTRSLLEADQILVLDQGRQVALGTHSALLAQSDLYREIHDSQTSGEEVTYHETEI